MQTQDPFMRTMNLQRALTARRNLAQFQVFTPEEMQRMTDDEAIRSETRLVGAFNQALVSSYGTIDHAQ